MSMEHHYGNGAAVVERAFVMTDIVGSTALVCRIGDATYLEVIERHDHIMLAALRRDGGEVIRNLGDGVLVAFTEPVTAVWWIDEVHDSIREELDLAIRVGAHFGPAYVRLADYVGKSIHVVARLASLAAAGELLASTDFARRAELPVDGEVHQVALRGMDVPTDILSIELPTGGTYNRHGGQLGPRHLVARGAAG
jgi:class 3 adenylate cyclase